MQGMHEAHDWPDLRVALVAHRAGSLAAAAARLGVDASTMSRRLSALERQLGAALFQRTPSGLVPTPLGERVLPLAEGMEAAMQDVARVAQGVQSQAAGHVRLACPEGLALQVLVPGLPALRAAHPALRLELSMGFAVADLTRREADLALRFVRPSRGDLVFRRVAELPLGAFIAPELLARLGPPARPEDLPWVGLAHALAHHPEARWLSQHVAAEPVLRFSSYVVLADAVRRGAGACVMTAAAAGALGLVPVPLALPPADRLSLYLVTHRALRRVPRVDAAWRWAEACCAAALLPGEVAPTG